MKRKLSKEELIKINDLRIEIELFAYRWGITFNQVLNEIKKEINCRKLRNKFIK